MYEMNREMTEIAGPENSPNPCVGRVRNRLNELDQI